MTIFAEEGARGNREPEAGKRENDKRKGNTLSEACEILHGKKV